MISNELLAKIKKSLPPYSKIIRIVDDGNRFLVFTGIGNFADAQVVIANKKSGEIKTVDIYSLRLKFQNK
ncbi:MAG: hypothetical protein II653_03945 [Lachnospiraceae bacterium]|nr:hypothetical protein [Lachnospiraceae bacterium]